MSVRVATVSRRVRGAAPPGRPWRGGVPARLECGSGLATGARIGPAQHHDRTGSPKPGPPSRRPRGTLTAPSSLWKTALDLPAIKQHTASRAQSTTENSPEHHDRV